MTSGSQAPGPRKEAGVCHNHIVHTDSPSQTGMVWPEASGGQRHSYQNISGVQVPGGQEPVIILGMCRV